MFYAKIENGIPIEYPITEKELRLKLSQVSLPVQITASSLEGLPYVLVKEGSVEDFPKETKEMRVVIGNIFYDNDENIWKREYILEKIEDENYKCVRLDRKWREIRDKRDKLMNDFDWRISRYHREVLLGMPPKEDINILNNYMQSLADITKIDDPFLVVFPELPNTNI